MARQTPKTPLALSLLKRLRGVDDEPTCPPKHIYCEVSSTAKEDVTLSFSLQARRTQAPLRLFTLVAGLPSQC